MCTPLRLLSLLACLVLACCTRREAPQSPPSESIVILLGDRESDDLGVFTLTPTEWTISNRSRASGKEKQLKSGAVSLGTLSYARTHLERATAAINRSEPGDRYRLVIRVRAPGAEVRELQASAETTAIFATALAGPLEPLWRQVREVPETYWYREVGPGAREHPEEKK